MKPRVTLYTRAGCCLCDTAKTVITQARKRAEFDYEEFDIDSDPELLRVYNDEVPVVAINRTPVFRYSVDLGELLRRLKAST
jgi:glutaredoxin